MYQLEILQQQGDKEAVDAFYLKHHRYPKIRKAQITQALNADEFEKVIRLCAESEQLDSAYAGLMHDWKKLRFEAYEEMGSTAEMIELAYLFALEGEELYYYKLREGVEPKQWPETQNALLVEMKTRPRSRPLYLGILIDEERVEELLDYCRAHVHEIENLHPYLLGDYPHEVNELYTTYIYRLIEPASDRKAYRNVCEKIIAFQQALGSDTAAGLIEELKFMYPKRRALLDELGKIK